jgi:toxin ParE1/3/4
MKPVGIRPLARAEVRDAAIYYHAEAGADLAEDFVAEVERAYGLLSESPGIGSPRYAHVLPGMEIRVWPLRRFPYLIFYVNQPDHIDVVRVLHAHRDIPAALRSTIG